jgi:predicted RNA polymerase sigma factor
MAIRHEEITKLWHAHASALTLLARTRCNAAEDCVQEAYVRLAKLEELPREPIAWLAMSGWMASATRDSKLASETSVLQTPSKSVAASPVAPTMKIKNTDSKTDSKTVSKTNSTSASSLHSVGNDEFGLDMI